MGIEFPPSCEHICRVVGFEDKGQQRDMDRQDKPWREAEVKNGKLLQIRATGPRREQRHL